MAAPAAAVPGMIAAERNRTFFLANNRRLGRGRVVVIAPII
jgi:hypothetical protein